MTEEPKHRRDPRQVVLAVIAIAVAAYALLFIVLNAHRVRVSFVFTKTHVSLIYVIVLSLAAGYVLGYVVPRLNRHRQRRR